MIAAVQDEWDALVRSAAECRSDQDCQRVGGPISPWDAIVAADAELLQLRKRVEWVSGVVLGVVIAALAIGCMLGWCANETTRPIGH